MLNLYIDLTKLLTLDWSILLKILGRMPIQFFSMETIYIDNEGLTASAQLIEKLGK